MIGLDKFGFRLGSKRSIAASLYERGATQADMIAATGTTQYNMLKDAERRGHRIIVKGDRYWLLAVGGSATVADSGNAYVGLPQEKSEALLSPPVRREERAVRGEAVAVVPAVLSVIGWHGEESPKDIVARKAWDIVKAGRTLWVVQSWKAKAEAVQAFGRAYPGAVVYFLEGGATPAGTSQAVVQVSEDRQTWGPLPKGIGKVTGKLGGATALVLDRLTPSDGTTFDLWQFAEYPDGGVLRFMLGASTACVVPATDVVAGMKSRYRRVVASGRLAAPFAVFLR
ncbi:MULTISPECIES: hypothetical protein [unclassified Mesorhizobium]|uniref:hypothetical protein n=1 Tax=unclassified Mesorhizobium TaxID=325217 RepID=UPI00333DB292